jgi:hypothetical protein
MPSIAAHISDCEAVYTEDFLRGLLDGKRYVVGGQLCRAVKDEREMLRQCRWASRPAKLWDES